VLELLAAVPNRSCWQQRLAAIVQYRLDNSTPIDLRPRSFATRSVVPLPQKGCCGIETPPGELPRFLVQGGDRKLKQRQLVRLAAEKGIVRIFVLQLRVTDLPRVVQHRSGL
jgi:hypothetical protein